MGSKKLTKAYLFRSLYHKISLLGRNSSGSSLENQEYGLGIRHADHVTLSIRKKLALTSLTSNGRSVGIVRLRAETTELLFIIYVKHCYKPSGNR
jgi:hypothetical protein